MRCKSVRHSAGGIILLTLTSYPWSSSAPPSTSVEHRAQILKINQPNWHSHIYAENKLKDTHSGSSKDAHVYMGLQAQKWYTHIHSRHHALIAYARKLSSSMCFCVDIHHTAGDAKAGLKHVLSQRWGGRVARATASSTMHPCKAQRKSLAAHTIQWEARAPANILPPAACCEALQGQHNSTLTLPPWGPLTNSAPTPLACQSICTRTRGYGQSAHPLPMQQHRAQLPTDLPSKHPNQQMCAQQSNLRRTDGQLRVSLHE
jgi:hypothetical protein